MNFAEKVKSFTDRINAVKDNIQTEEATKTSLVMPFFQALGYDIFNPNEFSPEFIADVGIKKGEKVDYAIQIDGEPVILIECKSITQNLEKHDSQLFRYFGTSAAKFAILTNGIIYRFYTDIEETNKMDEAPFLEINLLDIKDHHITSLQKFTKENFNKDEIFGSAAELKYISQIRQILKDEMNSPSDELVRMVLGRGVYNGVKTQSIIEKYQALTKRAFNLVISEMINDRLKNALQNEKEKDEEIERLESEQAEESEPRIITTEEELECYYTIKAILRDKISGNRITYQDKETYFAILLDTKVTKWIARIYIRDKVKYMVIPVGDTKHRFDFKTPDDLYSLSQQLVNRLDELK